MKLNKIFGFVFLLLLSLFSVNAATYFSQIESDSSGNIFTRDVLTDGNYTYVLTYSERNSSGSYDYGIAKFTIDGELVDHKVYGDANSNQHYEGIILGDYIYMVGNDGGILKVNKNTLSLTANKDTTSVTWYGITTDGTYLYTAGKIGSGVQGSSSYYENGYLAKWDTSLNEITKYYQYQTSPSTARSDWWTDIEYYGGYLYTVGFTSDGGSAVTFSRWTTSLNTNAYPRYFDKLYAGNNGYMKLYNGSFYITGDLVYDGGWYIGLIKVSPTGTIEDDIKIEIDTTSSGSVNRGIYADEDGIYLLNRLYRTDSTSGEDATQINVISHDFNSVSSYELYTDEYLSPYHNNIVTDTENIYMSLVRYNATAGKYTSGLFTLSKDLFTENTGESAPLGYNWTNRTFSFSALSESPTSIGYSSSSGSLSVTSPSFSTNTNTNNYIYYLLGSNIQADVQTQYNLEDVIINVSTIDATNTDFNYILDNNNLTSLCTNQSSCILNLTDLSFGDHNITFYDANNLTLYKEFSVEYQYVYFEDENTDLISNFTINGTLYENYASLRLSDYGYGTHTFLFEKLGFNSSTFQLTFNETSFINTTFSVPGAKVEIAIYDITDYTIISGSNTTIEIIGDSYSDIFTTSTGYLNISNVLMEEETYSLIVSNADYETSTFYFNFNNQEVINVDAYLTPLEVNETLIADLIIRVVDDYQSPLKGINVIQYVWDSGQSRYVQANLKATDYNGETSFKVFLNTKLYNFCAEYQGIQYCENDLSININTEEVVIEVPISELAVAEEDTIYDIDFSYSLTNSSYESGGINYTSVTFSYSNPNQDVDEYCLKIYQVANLQRTLVANQCDTAHSGGLSVNIVENTSNTYVAVATIQLEDSIRELDSLYLYAEYELQEELETYGFVKIIILAIAAFIIGLALHKKVHNIAIAHFGLPVIFLIFTLFFPDYVSFESFVLVLLVNIFAYKMATQKDDLQREAKFTTLNSILALYMIFIFGLHTALTEIDNKGMLDDYGNVILDNIEDDNSYFNSYMDTTIDNLKDKRADGNIGAWELLTGIFLKTLEFVDTFFSILSNLFSIATNIGLIIGIKNALLLKFIKLIDYIIVAYVLYLYFKEAFK